MPLAMPAMATAALIPTIVLVFTAEIWDVAFHMPDEAIPTETGRNMEAAYYAIEQAAMLEKADDDRAPTLLPDTAMCMTPP